MYELPTSIEIDNQEFRIRNNGDYRVVLDCFNALEDIELDLESRIVTCLVIFYEDMESVDDILKLPNLQKAVSEMYRFFNCGQVESPGASSNNKLIDWAQDSQLIFAAINNVSNKEVRLEPYIHWWTFMGYYTSIGQSVLSEVVCIRNKILKNKKLEAHEKEFRQNNPQYFNWNAKSVEAREADEWARSIWNSGK